MIDYKKVSKGDILRIVGEGAPGFAALGDLVRVIGVCDNRVSVEKKNGEKALFFGSCGATRLEPTKWKGEFPEEGQKEQYIT